MDGLIALAQIDSRHRQGRPEHIYSRKINQSFLFQRDLSGKSLVFQEAINITLPSLNMRKHE